MLLQPVDKVKRQTESKVLELGRQDEYVYILLSPTENLCLLPFIILNETCMHGIMKMAIGE